MIAARTLQWEVAFARRPHRVYGDVTVSLLRPHGASLLLLHCAYTKYHLCHCALTETTQSCRDNHHDPKALPRNPPAFARRLHGADTAITVCSQLLFTNQGKSEGFDSCDRPSNLTQIGFIVDFPVRVTLKLDGWPQKIIGHVFYTTSSFVHHFKSISELKLELQSGNTQFGSNSTIFTAVWPSNLMDDLENKRVPLLCYFKLFFIIS